MALAFLCFELICTRFLRCLWQRSLIDLSIGQTLARRDRTEKIVIRPSGYAIMGGVSVGKVAMIWN